MYHRFATSREISHSEYENNIFVPHTAAVLGVQDTPIKHIVEASPLEITHDLYEAMRLKSRTASSPTHSTMVRFTSAALTGTLLAIALLSENVAAFVAHPLAIRTDKSQRCTSNVASSLNMGSGYFLRPGPVPGNTEKESKNEELAFKSMISNLKNVMGREGFRGEDAQKHLNIMEQVENEVEREEKRFLGSRRLYKFTKAATTTLQRPMKRKNHPGEEYRASRH